MEIYPGNTENAFIRKENCYGIRKECQINLYLVYSLRLRKKTIPVVEIRVGSYNKR